MGKEKINMGDMSALEAKKAEYAKSIQNAKKEEVGPISPSEEFEKKLLVDVTQMNTNPYITRFEKLAPEEENKIKYFFKGLTEQEFLNAGDQNSKSGRTKGGTPFKCVVTPLNGTLIITKDTLIRTNNVNEENGTIDATRRNADGSLSKLQMEKRMGMIVSAKNYHVNEGLSIEEQTMIDAAMTTAGSIREGNKKELEGKSPEERLAFLQTMKALGVKRNDGKPLSEMTDAELEAFKKGFDQETAEMEAGKRDHRSMSGTFTRGKSFKVSDTLNTTAVSVDIGIDDKEPETIRNLTSLNGKQKMEIYRRTADGKYVETTDFHMSKGKPKYNVYTYEQVAKRVGNNLINLEDVIQDCIKMKEFEPKEIDSIARDTERTLDREKEEEREEQDPFMPGMRRPDPRR